MPHISEINSFPLAGARAESLQQATITPDGILGNRQFTLYDPTKHARIGQKLNGELARVTAWLNDDYTGLNFFAHHPEQGYLCINPFNYDAWWRGAYEVKIDESFGKEDGGMALAWDLGGKAAEYFSGIIDKPARLGQVWNRTAPPDNRALAPLHIISKPSLDALAEYGHDQGITPTADRFRANLVIDGDDIEPFTENEWVGKRVEIGGTAIYATRLTGRCAVPGYDQIDGTNRKDVPKLYRNLARTEDGRAPAFGVYAYPVLSTPRTIRVGDQVEI